MSAEVAAAAERLDLRAGEWLFREGEPADSLYLVCSGGWKHYPDATGTEAIRVLGRRCHPSNWAKGELL